ncbi:hypothetical protein YC2023_059642 [Brassica napus]
MDENGSNPWYIKDFKRIVLEDFRNQMQLGYGIFLICAFTLPSSSSPNIYNFVIDINISTTMNYQIESVAVVVKFWVIGETTQVISRVQGMKSQTTFYFSDLFDEEDFFRSLLISLDSSSHHLFVPVWAEDFGRLPEDFRSTFERGKDEKHVMKNLQKEDKLVRRHKKK